MEEESRLDKHLERLHTALRFLWEEHGFRVCYMTRDYGVLRTGFAIGLENGACRLAFSKEVHSPLEPVACHAGPRRARFGRSRRAYTAEKGWLRLGVPAPGGDLPPDVDRDLERLAGELRAGMGSLLERFGGEDGSGRQGGER